MSENKEYVSQIEGQSNVYISGDAICTVAAVAAVEEQPDRFEGLAGGIRNRGDRDRPGRLGVVVHRAPKAPGFVLGGWDLLGGGHRFLLRVDRCDTRSNALFD